MAFCLAMVSCHDLDLNPLSQGSTDTWYATADELRMAVNQGYRSDFLRLDGDREFGCDDDWSDDTMTRDLDLSGFTNGTLNSSNWIVRSKWQLDYKLITRMNSVINKAQRAIDNGANAEEVARYVGEAHFFRGRAYGDLVFHWGDVPYYTTDMSIDSARTVGRTPKEEVLKHVYEDFDAAVAALPVSYNGEQRVTKGAALAFKAQYALYMGDYATAATAAKACMDLGVYSLEKDYSHLFEPSNNTSPEFIFIMPRSLELKINLMPKANAANDVLVRNAGGSEWLTPTWDLFAAYTCTDGLPIDKSPLFDPHDPFKNRDPRLSMTIVPFGSEFMGFIYDPSPAARTTKRLSDGAMVKNNDCRLVTAFASYSGIVFKKYASQEWLDNGRAWTNPKILMRYADVLLMYAEAKIELNQIDQSVIDAMNMVRARAYSVDKSDVTAYPAFTIKSQAEMRHDVRLERRVELAYEWQRYPDIIRWKIAPDVFSRKRYGMNFGKMQEIYDQGNWFWGITPKIDENGVADFTELEAKGLCMPLMERKWDDRQYLFPIPDKEIEINPNMKQNPGY